MVFLFGATYIRPDVSNSAPRNRLRPNPLFPALGIEDDFRSESVSLDASSTATLALIFKYYFSDHWALNFTGGIPRKATLSARGTVGPTGPLRAVNSIDLSRERFNPVASARIWAPILQLEYHFHAPEAPLRPYLAAGLTYTFFTELETNDALNDATNRQFGTPLALAAGRPGPTSNTAEIDDVFAPVFTMGLGYRISQHWKLSGSVSYIPLDTTARVRLNAEDGTELARTRTRLYFDPLVFNLLVGYRF